MLKIILIMAILSFIIFSFIKKKENLTPNYVFINKKTRKYHQEKYPYSKNLESITLEMAIKEGFCWI